MPQTSVAGFNFQANAQGRALVDPTVQQGRSFFVNGASGNDARGGLSWRQPLATLAKAFALALPGDVIYVAPGTYAENVTVTTDFLTVIGAAPSGYGRPDWVPAAGSALVVQAQGFAAQNIRFSNGDDTDVVAQHGNGFRYDSCVFDGAAQGATHALLRLVGAVDDHYSASEGVVSNNLFRGSPGIGIALQCALAAAGGEGTSDNQIFGNAFVGNGVDIKSLTNVNGGGAGLFIRTQIAGNRFETVGAAFVYMALHQGAAGDLAANSALISGNVFADVALIAAQVAIAGQPNVIFAGNYDAKGLVDGSAFNA